MSKKLKLNEIFMLRDYYYKYIYENYIRELPLSDEEKIEQTMRMHHLKP